VARVGGGAASRLNNQSGRCQGNGFSTPGVKCNTDSTSALFLSDSSLGGLRWWVGGGGAGG